MTQARVDHFRAFARFTPRLAIWVSPLGGTDEQPVELVNIGLGGLCFECNERVETGARLRLELELPGLWDRLTLHAEVAWVQASGEGLTRTGVRYTRPTGHALRLLAENIG